MNKYLDKLKEFEGEFKKEVNDIFGHYNNFLFFRLEDFNLLEEGNAVETSTTIGFIIEEFLIARLKERLCTKYRFDRPQGGGKDSYDCYCTFKGIRVLINIKVQKAKSNNNAVAAIKNLYEDYVKTDPDTEKAYYVLKLNYECKTSENGERKINIVSCDDSYFLEKINFKKCHKQDKRSWSGSGNSHINGRLLVSKKWMKEHLLDESDISYENTKSFIEAMLDPNHIDSPKKKLT